MALMSPRFRQQPRLQSAASNAPPFRRGEISVGVRALQEALVDLGYAMPNSCKKNDCDGNFGPETERTVRQFQTDHRLSVDGVAGRQTLTTMDQIFLAHDPYYKDPLLENAKLQAQLAGSPGRGPYTCTTARK
ncbi:MAG: peptidoglycan-binding protein [Bryobacterales bacterium]|nr:peptidoglycan-binding protein [Bryobacterales bacterium]